MNKNIAIVIIVSLLLIILATLVYASGILNTQSEFTKNDKNKEVVEKKDLAEVKLSEEKLVNLKGKILLGELAEYKNLNQEEKIILDSYNKKFKLDIKDTCFLKYYSNSLYIIGCDPILGDQIYFNFLDNKLNELKPDFNSETYPGMNVASFYKKNSGFIETKDYIINILEDKILYFKNGTKNLELLTGSKLEKYISPLKIGETGESYSGIEYGNGPEFEYYFDKDKNILTVSVYKKEGKTTYNTPSNTPNNNDKLREVSFILP